MTRFSRIAALAPVAALLLYGCTIARTERSTLSGPSEAALSLSLYANPDVLTENGQTAQIVVQARDANGQAVKSLPLRFEVAVSPTSVGTGALSATSMATDSDGRATITYTAPTATTSATAQISATAPGSDFANAVTKSVTIRLVPPAS